MQVETSLLKLPGIDTVTPKFLCALVDMSVRHGWDPNGVALVISEESKFNPTAKNPSSSASGLIQIIESTASSLGTTTAQIRAMSAEEQLPLVEQFFATTLKGRVPSRIEDYVLAAFGRADLIGAPDSTVVFTRGSAAYAGNSLIDLNGDGVITVGEVRAYMRGVLGRAKGVIGVYPSICYESVTPPSTRASAVAATTGLLALVAAAGYGVYSALTARRSGSRPKPSRPPPVRPPPEPVYRPVYRPVYYPTRTAFRREP